MKKCIVCKLPKAKSALYSSKAFGNGICRRCHSDFFPIFEWNGYYALFVIIKKQNRLKP